MDIASPSINTYRMKGIPVPQMNTPFSGSNLVIYLQPNRIRQLAVDITLSSDPGKISTCRRGKLNIKIYIRFGFDALIPT